MTVQELIDRLSQFPKDMKVVVQYRDDGGDYNGIDDEVRAEEDNGVIVL
jgi:hypothetical protein